jgi:predicted dehydrogenase
VTGAGPGVGVVGLGFMGRTHLEAWQRAASDGHPCRVVAVCDRDPERRAGRTGAGGNLSSGEAVFDPATVTAHEEAEALFADPAVDIVSITTPTDSHVPLALAALAAGKHVLVEKPVALASEDVARLGEAARTGDRLVMPAFCIRFWPGWSWLHQTLRSGELGALRSLSIRRLSGRPDWNASFYGDVSRTGGALVDLHLHDADLVRWCLGDPDFVHTVGDHDHVTTTYRYGGGAPHVVAEGGWDHAPGFGFRMEYVAVFEGGTADYGFGREQPLRVSRVGEAEASGVPLPDLTGYDVQCRALLDALASGASYPPATLGEAFATARLLEAELESLESGRPVALPRG